MRLAIKSTLAFLLIYLIIVGGVAWWMAVQLQSLAASMAEGTAQLVGSEVARALADSAVDQLVRADDTTRARLEQIVDDVTQHSSILTSVAVVDRGGTVIAGDHVEVGRQLAIPDVIFDRDYSVRLMNENEPFGAGAFYMLVPLKADKDLAGYLRLEMQRAHCPSLPRGARNLGLVALAGLCVVVGAGALAHPAVASQRNPGSAARRAVRGETVEARKRDEFSPALAVAREVGREAQRCPRRARPRTAAHGLLLKALDIGALVPARPRPRSRMGAPSCSGCTEPAELAHRWDGEFRHRVAEILHQIGAAVGR
jgi:hypothetical protein